MRETKSKAARGNRPVVAYLAGAFPKQSETFVYREVRALRALGWEIVCATMHSSDSHPENSDDLLDDLVIVYSQDSLKSVVLEVITHPLCSLRTLAQALGDALVPAETTSLKERSKLPLQGAAALGFARLLRARNVSHVHAHFAHAPTTVAMYAAHHLGVPFSFTGHANDIFERRALLKKKLKRATFVASISDWHRHFYLEEQPRTNAHVVRCGVDTESWLPVVHEDPLVAPLRLTTLCRLVEKKGIDTLIRALALMKQPAQLCVAGDGPEKQRLMKLAQEVKCDDRVTWLGAVENDTARQILQRSQVFVLPCRTDKNGDRDGIPVALMEAMACGLVVVSGDLPAIRELIESGHSGYLLEKDDPKALAEVLDRLATARLFELGEAGRARVVEEFSLSKNIERLTSLFSKGDPQAPELT